MKLLKVAATLTQWGREDEVASIESDWRNLQRSINKDLSAAEALYQESKEMHLSHGHTITIKDKHIETMLDPFFMQTLRNEEREEQLAKFQTMLRDLLGGKFLEQWHQAINN